MFHLKKKLAPLFICATLVMSNQDNLIGQTETNDAPAAALRDQQNASVGAKQKSTARVKTKYNPLEVSSKKIMTLELTVKDKKRAREVPLLVYLPASTTPAPIIIHSHGLGGSRYTSEFLGEHWASRGYVVVFTQHPGSDDSVWRDVPKLKIMRAMKKAASGKNLALRVGDVHSVLDQLEKWNVQERHHLQGRLELQRIGMSGHSFGALTTQRVAGQKVFGSQAGVDSRIKAAIPMSPSTHQSESAEKSFKDVTIPWLCMTGTNDVSKIGAAGVDSRLGVFPALPEGGNCELVLFDAEHNVFTETPVRRGKPQRNPKHHPAIKAISTAFWDTHLKKDQAASEWLDSDEIRTVLEPKDSWKVK